MRKGSGYPAKAAGGNCEFRLIEVRPRAAADRECRAATEKKAMNSVQGFAFDNEIRLARELIANGELEASFPHLERAHVIGQAFVVPHATSHWLMLKVELRRGRAAASLGQVARIVLGVIGSAVGVVPVGNTGGTDVSMFKRMPVASDLQDIIDAVSSDPPVQLK
jgi:Protein of unknown function (DUF3703)